jgi:predicted DNA-binding transcriptional regulator AlpA
MLNPHLPETGFLRLPQVLALIPVSRSSWWAGIKTGRFPAPVKLSPRCTAWSVADIRAWIDAHAGGSAEPERPSAAGA